jgi:hypothetical protein
MKINSEFRKVKIKARAVKFRLNEKWDLTLSRRSSLSLQAAVKN